MSIVATVANLSTAQLLLGLLTIHERMKQNRHNSGIAVFSRLGFFYGRPKE